MDEGMAEQKAKPTTEPLPDTKSDTLTQIRGGSETTPIENPMAAPKDKPQAEPQAEPMNVDVTAEVSKSD